MKKYLYSVFVMAIFAIGFGASDDSGSNKKDTQSSSISENSDVENAESIEESDATQYTDESDNFEDPTDERYAWLQGHWVYEQGGYEGHLVIDGDKITQYSSKNPKPDKYSYRIEDGAIRATLIDGMDMVIEIDFANHRLDYGDGLWMHKVDDSTYNSSTNHADQRLISRLNDLDRKAKELTSELLTMQQSRQVDPMRLMYLSQTILGYKQEQISIAERLADANLIYQYQQEYGDVAEILRMMETEY